MESGCGEESEELGVLVRMGRTYSSFPCFGHWYPSTLGKGFSLGMEPWDPHPGLNLLESTWRSEQLFVFANPGLPCSEPPSVFETGSVELQVSLRLTLSSSGVGMSLQRGKDRLDFGVSP